MVVHLSIPLQVVSILTRLLNRMQRPARPPGGRLLGVSILTRLLNRMQLFIPTCWCCPGVFQSSTGCNGLMGGGLTQAQVVSILTRLLNRMQHDHPSGYRVSGGCFNPHPASQPDATAKRCELCYWVNKFQSSPGFSTGCNAPGRRQRPDPCGFQSSPGFSTGCNAARLFLVPPLSSFNPHPASQPDATSRRSGSASGSLWFQSSPGFSTGCNCHIPG